MSLFEELKELGTDIDEGLARLGGNKALYERLLDSFIKAMETNNVEPDFDVADLETIIEKTHAIKGVAGNLSITPIYEAYTNIVALLRKGETGQARKALKDIKSVQENIIQCIKKYKN